MGNKMKKYWPNKDLNHVRFYSVDKDGNTHELELGEFDVSSIANPLEPAVPVIEVKVPKQAPPDTHAMRGDVSVAMFTGVLGTLRQTEMATHLNRALITGKRQAAIQVGPKWLFIGFNRKAPIEVRDLIAGVGRVLRGDGAIVFTENQVALNMNVWQGPVFLNNELKIEVLVKTRDNQKFGIRVGV